MKYRHLRTSGLRVSALSMDCMNLSFTDLRASFPRFTKEAMKANMPVIHMLRSINRHCCWLSKMRKLSESWAPFAEGRNNIFSNEVLERIESMKYYSAKEVYQAITVNCNEGHAVAKAEGSVGY